ncbi:hypothetical protein BTZ20_2804 [Rhodococcus sp. MTM3W5.2]|nr:hypothetical protein BTZ20_2804 [Rhodococcus sp. MTM3W5.2]
MRDRHLVTVRRQTLGHREADAAVASGHEHGTGRRGGVRHAINLSVRVRRIGVGRWNCDGSWPR